MYNILTNNDVKWINSLIFNNNTKYNYEVEIRFLDIDKHIYSNILQYFESLLKEHKSEKIISNIIEEIKYDKNANFIKRQYRNKEKYIIKKRLKWKYFENIPANINLSTELICDKVFNVDVKFKKRDKKRISFINKYLIFDFTIINDAEYSIEIEFKNYIYINKLDILNYWIQKILNYIPVENFVKHKLISYKIPKKLKQPTPLKDKNIIKTNYAVTPKFDGIRSILYINNENNVFLIKNNFRTIINTNLICKNISNIVIDGELIDDKIFYAIDIIFYEENDLKNYDIEERINLLKSIKFIYKNINKSIYYKVKKYYFYDIEKNCKKILKTKYSYILNKNKNKILIDGLIFNSKTNSYNECTVFKWKPIITFDFKIKKIIKSNNYVSWELYCYTYNKEYTLFPKNNYGITHISHKIDELYNDDSIIEFYFDNNYNEFKPIKLRIDKIYPNFINIALDNWDCLLNDINFN